MYNYRQSRSLGSTKHVDHLYDIYIDDVKQPKGVMTTDVRLDYKKHIAELGKKFPGSKIFIKYVGKSYWSEMNQTYIKTK